MKPVYLKFNLHIRISVKHLPIQDKPSININKGVLVLNEFEKNLCLQLSLAYFEYRHDK